MRVLKSVDYCCSRHHTYFYVDLKNRLPIHLALDYFDCSPLGTLKVMQMLAIAMLTHPPGTKWLLELLTYIWQVEEHVLSWLVLKVLRFL